MTQSMPRIIPVLTVMICVFSCLAAVDHPLGHADFVPTPERPVGWRGDGTGRFLGATPVTDWDLKTGRNVIWQTRLPFFSASGPIVVGDKVFTTAEPDLLICINAADGTELWRRHGAVFMESLPEAERERLYGNVEKLYDMAEAWARQPTVYDGKNDGNYGDVLVNVWIPSGGHHAGDGAVRFQADIAVLAAERNVDLKRIREMYQEVGTMGDKKMQQSRTVPLKTPGGRCLMSDLWCGSTAPTPVSDGTYVVQRLFNARFSESYWGYLVCYDLHGKRQWFTEIGKGGTWDYTYDSPLIIDGLVISQDRYVVPGGKDKNPADMLSAFDIKTGRRVWSVPAPHDCQTPLAVEIEGAKAIHLCSVFYAPKSGQRLLDMRPFVGADVNTPCIQGDIFFTKGREGKTLANRNGAGRDTVPAIVRLKWKEKEVALEYEEVWLGDDVKNVIGWNRGSPMYHNGRIYQSKGGVIPAIFIHDTRVKYAKGMEVVFSPDKKDCVRDIGKGALSYGAPSEDDMSVVMGGGFVYGCPTTWPSQFVTVSVPPDPKVVAWPVVDGAVMGSPYFQGDRLYIRDYRYLYCFGDPKAAYHLPAGK